MIDVDISHIWSGIALPELLEIEKDISAAHEKLAEGLARQGTGLDLDGVTAAAQTIRKTAPVCVVLASHHQCSGVRAALELLPDQGDAPQLIFGGDTLSVRQWNELTMQLEGKDFTVIVISETGTTLESAVAFRGLRWMMERRFGTEKAARRIYAVTQENSPLWQMAIEQHWTHLPMAGDAVGLLPLAVAGVDVTALLRGGEKAREAYNLRSFENPLWLYAGVRNALYHKGYGIEVFGGFGPGFRQLGAWWQQLFARTEGSCGKGAFPIPAEYPQDLHALGWRLQAGGRMAFETMVRFDAESSAYTIVSDVSDLEGLNHLAGKTLEEVRQLAYEEVLSAHDDAGVPVMTMDLGKLDAEKLGEVFCFFALACGLSACMLGVDCFPQQEDKTE